MSDSVFITRVVLKNYKSIASCSVRLHPLIFMVGQNGSGKSNFLDALRLVNESLNSSLDHALRERGGVNEVRRRSTGHPTHFGIRFEFSLPDSTSGVYAFRVGAKPKGGFEVQREECRIFAPDALHSEKMPRGQAYSESSDQAALSSVFDMNAARRADSFDKFYREVSRLIEALRAFDSQTSTGS